MSIPAHLSLPGSQTVPCICGGSRERVSCPCFAMVQDPGAQGKQGLIAFASALPPEAVDLCLVTLARRRAFPTLSSQGQTGFASILAMGARGFAAPLPAAEGFASFARRVQEVAEFHTCFSATADHARATKADSLVHCPTSFTLVGTGRRPAQNCLQVRGDSCCVWSSGLS